MKFNELGLNAKILKAIEDKGYTEATPIQAQAIPAVLKGRDIMAAAQTGTGKTAGFTLPILEKLCVGEAVRSNHCRVLIITPTRELAAQIGENILEYSKYLKIRSTVVFGGVKINPQMKELRRGVDILVATPGRLMDLYSQNAVKFSQVEVLVLDEADRMLDMGFVRDIKKLIALLPKSRQNLLFSATFSKEIRTLAKGLINNPIEISVDPPNTTVEKVDQWVVPVDKKMKSAALIHLIKENSWKQALIFCRTKHGANRLSKRLDAVGFSSAAIHGNKSQGARTKALAGFKEGSIMFLVATDIAARGIDIDLLPQVVNFDLPHVAEDYVHRIGRTGRAGSSGMAVSLVCGEEFPLLKGIERLTKQVIRREGLVGFDPGEYLPESELDTREIRTPRRKKFNKPSKNANFKKISSK